MSAASETEVANLALSHVGNQMISDLAEGTPAADLCNLYYPRVRDAVLRAHPWNFAIRRSTLAQSSTPPNHEYDYQFTLPVGPAEPNPYCLKVIRTNLEADGITGAAIYGFPGINGICDTIAPYRIEGRNLLCNETVIKIEYIGRVLDTSIFDALFTDCLSYRLAAALAPRLTDNQSAAKTLMDIYQSMLPEARTTDAQEGTPRDVIDTSPWLVARI